MTIPNHPLIASVKPLLKATGAELVAADALIAGDIPLVWEGVTIAGVRLPALHGALCQAGDQLVAHAVGDGVALRQLIDVAGQVVHQVLVGEGQVDGGVVPQVAQAPGQAGINQLPV